MTKFKLRQKVMIDGSYFIDKQPKRGVVAGVSSNLFNPGLFTLGLVHFHRTANEHTTYKVAREVDAYGDKVRVVFEDDEITEDKEND